MGFQSYSKYKSKRWWRWLLSLIYRYCSLCMFSRNFRNFSPKLTPLQMISSQLGGHQKNRFNSKKLKWLMLTLQSQSMTNLYIEYNEVICSLHYILHHYTSLTVVIQDQKSEMFVSFSCGPPKEKTGWGIFIDSFLFLFLPFFNFCFTYRRLKKELIIHQ